MKMRLSFAISAGIIVSTFFLFVVFYGSYVQDREQKRVNNHSKVIASAMWDFEAEGMMEYLRLACKAYKYGRIIVTQDSGEIFIDLEHSFQKPIDRFLISLNLIASADIISDVVYKEKIIGQITATWYNTAVYIYSYALILVFLLVAVLWYYLRTLTAKLVLEAHVIERTADLREEITERKNAEEALRESEEKYRRIFENSVVGIFQSTPEGRFIGVNPAFAKMLRYEYPEDLVASISDIATQYYVNPKDRKQYQEVLQQNGRVDGFEFKIQRKDGSEIWVSNSTRAYFDEEGKILHYEGIISDIKEVENI